MSEEKIRISIIEDSAIHVDWLQLEISDDPSYEIVSIDHLGRAGIESIKKHQPHIVLLDFQLEDITAVEVIRRIRPHFKDIKILAMTAFTEASILERLVFEADIDGVAIKGSHNTIHNFLGVLQDLMKMGSHLDSSLHPYIKNKNRADSLHDLTPRECEVFFQINMGKTIPEIARDLSLEISTINNIKSIIAKKVKLSDTDSKSLMNKLKKNINPDMNESLT